MPINFSVVKGFMIDPEFSYSGKLKLRRGRKNIETNSKYYQKKVLLPIFNEEIPFFHDFHRIKRNLDKARSHTSKNTTAFLVKMKTSTECIPFNIFLQSPLMFHLWTIVPLVY